MKKMFKVNHFQINARNTLINASKCCLNVIFKNTDMLASEGKTFGALRFSVLIYHKM